MTSTKLLCSFITPDKYSENLQSIREYYKDFIIDDKIRVLSIEQPNTLAISEYVMLWNISFQNKIIFRRNDLIVNKSGKTIYSINGLNALLRSKNLERGTRIDFTEFENMLITELADAPLFRKTRFLCFG
jgi:hypothetical protein